jgi:hypothetical protein
MTLAATRIAAEEAEVEQIDRHLEKLDAKLREALLVDNNDDEVAQLDADIASNKRQREHHLLRIDSLRAREALEQKTAATKQHAELVGRVEAEIDELEKVRARFAKRLAEVVNDWREIQDRSVKIAVAWPWRISDRIASGFDLDEITRDVKHELCRVGSGQLLHAGAIQRPSFPGGLNPKLEWLHDPGGKIPALVEVTKQRHAVAKRVLQASRPVTEPNMEKAS